MWDSGDQTGIYDIVWCISKIILGHSAGALNTDKIKELYERIIKEQQPNDLGWVEVGWWQRELHILRSGGCE